MDFNALNSGVVQIGVKVEIQLKLGIREPKFTIIPSAILNHESREYVMNNFSWKMFVKVYIFFVDEILETEMERLREKLFLFVGNYIESNPFYRNLIIDDDNIRVAIPPAIKDSLQLFRKENSSDIKTAFIMMDFANTKAHNEVANVVKSILEEFGIKGLRADERSYHTELYYNILTFMHGCDIGIAIFDRILREEHNPNVALEVGYMLALNKPVCILKDQSVKLLPTDLAGKLYVSFDTLDIANSVKTQLPKWLSNNNFSVFSRNTRRLREGVDLYVKVKNAHNLQQNRPPTLSLVIEPPDNFNFYHSIYLYGEIIVCDLTVHMYLDEEVDDSGLVRLREAVVIFTKQQVNSNDDLREIVTRGRFFP